MATPMSNEAIIKTLKPHAGRPIRAFLNDRKVVGTGTEEAFWHAVFIDDVQRRTLVDFQRALKIARAMQESAEPVSTVLEKVPA